MLPDGSPQFYLYQSVFADALAEMERAAALNQRLVRLVDGFCADLLGADVTDAAEVLPDGSFGYIAYDLALFLGDMQVLDGLLAKDPDYASAGLRYRPVRYLEIGCGAGRNLLALKYSEALDWVALHGFDIQAALIAAGQSRLGLAEELFVADAMTADYSAYDVVFSYRPFRDDVMQKRFEAHLHKSLPVGAYVVAPLSLNAAPSRRMRLMGDSNHIWKKVA